MKTIANLACGLESDASSIAADGCFNQQYVFTLIFAGAMVFVLQAPNMEQSWVLSTLGAATSVVYSLLALGLCIGKGGFALLA